MWGTYLLGGKDIHIEKKKEIKRKEKPKLRQELLWSPCFCGIFGVRFKNLSVLNIQGREYCED